MTLANRITIARLSAIPLFVILMLLYGQTVVRNVPETSIRMAAAILFITIFLLDTVDGALARLLHETTVLGSILDPVADKTLVISSLVVLWLMPADAFKITVPAWFYGTILIRDVTLITCSAILFRVNASAHIKPNIIGKLATFFNAAAIAIVLTGVAVYLFIPIAAVGALFAIISGCIYIFDGVGQFNAPHATEKALEQQVGK